MFINKTDVPSEWQKDVTYECILCDFRKEKVEPNKTRLAVGGDRMNYPEDCSTPTADLLTIKILFNNNIFTLRAKFKTMDN